MKIVCFLNKMSSVETRVHSVIHTCRFMSTDTLCRHQETSSPGLDLPLGWIWVSNTLITHPVSCLRFCFYFIKMQRKIGTRWDRFGHLHWEFRREPVLSVCRVVSSGRSWEQLPLCCVYPALRAGDAELMPRLSWKQWGRQPRAWSGITAGYSRGGVEDFGAILSWAQFWTHACRQSINWIFLRRG